MVSFILPGNSATGGYNVANSLRFNQPSSDYLNRTPSGAGNQKTFTVSCWYKRTNFGANDIIMSTTNGGSSFFSFGFIGSGTYADKFQFYHYDGTTDYGYHSAGLYRDTSAWYHIVLAIDTTQGTESNRAKAYINGVQETLTATYGAFPQNLDTYFNNTNIHYIGYNHDSSGALLNGYLSEVVNIDGQQLDPTSFGEFDEDSPTIWKPIDVSGLTFGTNGFYLDFENSGSLGADVSGNGNNFTVNNLTSVDQSTDTCTNNFATMNPLDNFYQGATFSEGNLLIATASSPYTYNTATMGMSSGKWYWEGKAISVGSGNSAFGIISTVSTAVSDEAPNKTDSAMYKDDGVVRRNNGNGTSIGAVNNNDIVSFAYDADNNFIYFALNGTWQNSGDPTSGASGTGGYDPGNVPASTATGFYFPMFSDHNSGSGFSMSFNFGSPPYAISSGNSDGNGYGNFEYSVPSGYYSLNSKNLAEFG